MSSHYVLQSREETNMAVLSNFSVLSKGMRWAMDKTGHYPPYFGTRSKALADRHYLNEKCLDLCSYAALAPNSKKNILVRGSRDDRAALCASSCALALWHALAYGNQSIVLYEGAFHDFQELKADIDKKHSSLVESSSNDRITFKNDSRIMRVDLTEMLKGLRVDLLIIAFSASMSNSELQAFEALAAAGTRLIWFTDLGNLGGSSRLRWDLIIDVIPSKRFIEVQHMENKTPVKPSGVLSRTSSYSASCSECEVQGPSVQAVDIDEARRAYTRYDWKELNELWRCPDCSIPLTSPSGQALSIGHIGRYVAALSEFGVDEKKDTDYKSLVLLALTARQRIWEQAKHLLSVDDVSGALVFLYSELDYSSLSEPEQTWLWLFKEVSRLVEKTGTPNSNAITTALELPQDLWTAFLYMINLMKFIAGRKESADMNE